MDDTQLLGTFVIDANHQMLSDLDVMDEHMGVVVSQLSIDGKTVPEDVWHALMELHVKIAKGRKHCLTFPGHVRSIVNNTHKIVSETKDLTSNESVPTSTS